MRASNIRACGEDRFLTSGLDALPVTLERVDRIEDLLSNRLAAEHAARMEEICAATQRAIQR